MAQKHLAQDLTTSKVASLPKELRDIAESLIGDKFGYEEVVERKSSNPFHYQTFWGANATGSGHVSVSGYTTYGIDPTFVRQVGSSQIVERFDIETRRSILSTPIKLPSTRSFMDATRRLNMADAKTDGRFAYLPREFARELFSTPDFQYHTAMERSEDVGHERYKGYYIGQLFGVKVFVSSDRKYPEIEAYR